ncbi:unnamed protein product (macronuclear) [Paramecium tetraurelia]|uniref:Transmembrane protein n=1 Tax=Paramecium tetraurelia TaxID=5888 RepID=A0CAN9_PARTE|nr:uncharacterized protein GSPATT00036637001 [Paramecium tetraurelia]CAK67856.1 unnamed protein product [Paramecium tetraurelia]|eukprot:XP_001435253.1 hypothetical protein (macronuclear) [Paramecium tetraurelia strain d4-2]
MQQVKYPQFDIQSPEQRDHAQPQLFQNTQEDIKYIPVLPQQNPNFQQYQQVILPYSQQINNNQPNYYNLDQPLQPVYSKLLKDQDFLTQKFFLSSILGMFTLWTFLFVLFLFVMQVSFSKLFYEHRSSYPYCISASVILLIVLVKLGSMERFRQVNKSQYINQSGLALLFYFGSIFAYTLIFFFILRASSSGPNSDLPSSFIVGIFIVIPLFANFIVTIILLIYILIENKEFRFQKVLFCEFLCVLPFAIIFVPMILSLIVLMPYTLLLMNVLKQIQSGRFNLNKDQVLSGTLAAYYGLFIPFDLFD